MTENAKQPGNHGATAVYAALLANLGIAIAKFIGFLITGASSLLAEAAHSAADTGNQGLLLLGMNRAKKERDVAHPFGYGRERYFWAFAVAMVLFSLGSLFSIYEGVEKLLHPHPIESPMVAIVILGVALILEGFSLRTAVKEARPRKGRLTWWRFIRESREAELPVVLLEDLAALIGLALALTGIGAAVLTGNAAYDALGTLSIGALLAVIAVVLAIEMKSLLLGEPLTADQEALIRSAIEESPVVERLIHMRTIHLGPDDVMVTAKVEFDGDLAFAAVTEAIDGAEMAIRDAVPPVQLIYIEPDVYEPGQVTESE